MDSLSNRTLLHLFEMLHDGPVKEIIQFMTQQNLRCTQNCDMETALRMTMTFVFTIERLRHAMLADWGVSDVSMLAPAAAPPTPPTQPALCGKCHGPIEHSFEFRGVDYCCMQCCHDAGDRRRCQRGCGCAGFAIKRRQLRDHRRTMRIMKSVIARNDLWEELDEKLMDRLGNLGASVGLDHDHELDEDSETEDPMVTQANELSNIDSIVQLSRNMVELAEVRRGLKRTRDSD